MKKFVLGMMAATSMSVPVMADDSKITKGYNSMDSMGCMLVRECTDGVKKSLVFWIFLVSMTILLVLLTYSDEFNRMLTSLSQVGVEVFLADKVFSALDIVVFIIL